jgi:hypothetical protein
MRVLECRSHLGGRARIEDRDGMASGTKMATAAV